MKVDMPLNKVTNEKIAQMFFSSLFVLTGWLIFTSRQFVLGYFIPKRWGIEHSCLYFLYSFFFFFVYGQIEYEQFLNW